MRICLTLGLALLAGAVTAQEAPVSEDGAALFETACAECHTTDDVSYRVPEVEAFRADHRTRKAPPYRGTDAELQAILDWLASL